MTMKKFYILVFIFSLMIACSEDGPPTKASNGTEDLPNKILGTWQLYDNYKITFYEDGTFSDSRDSTQWYSSFYIRSGEYEISHNLLQFKKFRFETYEPHKFAVSTVSYMSDYIISIQSDTLFRTPVTILSTNKTNDFDISKRWTLLKWIIYHRTMLIDPLYENFAELFYIFDDSTSSMQKGINYIHDNTIDPNFIEYCNYYYSHPSLQFCGSDTLKVNIGIDKMIWFDENNITKLVKIN